MKNSTNIKIPEKYHQMIDEIYRENDDNSIWVQVANGYYAAGMDGYDVCHTIHEDTIKQLMYQIRRIKPL